MASKIAMVFAVCIFALCLLQSSPSVTVTAQVTETPPEGPVVPPREKHYVRDCKRCCYLDEWGCLSCCGK
ncbi:hypothetical protein KI387_032636, partial [Taxus chinensis]